MPLSTASPLLVRYEIVWSSEEDFGRQVPTQFATEGTLNSDGLEREFLDSGWNVEVQKAKLFEALPQLIPHLRIGESPIRRYALPIRANVARWRCAFLLGKESEGSSAKFRLTLRRCVREYGFTQIEYF
jgi:hypothetical protein